MTEAPDHSRDDRPGPAAEPVSARFDWATTPPTRAVVETVALTRNVDPLSLPPLFDSLDPDALASLLTATGAVEPSLQVSFSFADTEVTVAADGTVAVRPA